VKNSKYHGDGIFCGLYIIYVPVLGTMACPCVMRKSEYKEIPLNGNPDAMSEFSQARRNI